MLRIIKAVSRHFSPQPAQAQSEEIESSTPSLPVVTATHLMANGGDLNELQHCACNVRIACRYFTSPRDREKIGPLECHSHDYPLTTDEVGDLLTLKHSISYGAFQGDKLVGYMVYRQSAPSYQILRFTVSPDFKDEGIAHKLLAHFDRKLEDPRFYRIDIDLRETSVELQLLLAARQFRAVEFHRAGCHISSCDIIGMRYERPHEAASLVQSAVHAPVSSERRLESIDRPLFIAA